MSQAKFFKQAQEIFPYKFNRGTKKQWLIKKQEEHPEYFQNNPRIRQKLLREISNKK